MAVSFIGGRNQSTLENHRLVVSHWQTLSYNVVSSTPRHERGSNSQLLVVIGTDCTGNCKSNYHTITTTTVPDMIIEKMPKQQLYVFHLRSHICDNNLTWRSVFKQKLNYKNVLDYGKNVENISKKICFQTKIKLQNVLDYGKNVENISKKKTTFFHKNILLNFAQCFIRYIYYFLRNLFTLYLMKVILDTYKIYLLFST